MIPATISGSLFAAGLEVSTMVKSTKIYGFLDLTGFSRGTYDPTLLVVMGGGMIWSMLSYQFIKGYQTKPFSKASRLLGIFSSFFIYFPRYIYLFLYHLSSLQFYSASRLKLVL